MAYEWDVFVSYHRKRCGNWVQQHLHKFLDRYLEDALHAVPRICIDTNVETGTVWPEDLVQKLGKSKCMVCIWAPSYFQSPWCVYECLTMLHRSQNTTGNPKLVLPINLSDSKGFPNYVQGIQWLDCRDFFLEGQAFEDSRDYLELQRTIRHWCQDVAKAINNAPRWQSEWISRSNIVLPELPQPVVPPLFMD